LSVVLDASMAIAWLFDDEKTAAAHAIMRRVAEEGAVVPAIWHLEVANVLENAVRRGRCDRGHVDRSLDRLGRMLIATDDETSRHAWARTLALARAHGLTTYDACYLELALRLGSPLATRDGALIAAARERRMPVLEA